MPYKLPEAGEEADIAISGTARALLSEQAGGLQITNVEQALGAARPRLLRQARRRGVASDAIDDVVQETLFEAWRHLNMLREPERFNAWLDGICRNMCLRWSQSQQRTARHQASLSSIVEEGQPGEDVGEIEIPDPLACDPVEELSKQDLVTLLDRALGHLPAEARTLIEMHYLAELPQREIARRLGLTVNVLEARLHRARRQLRQVLNGELSGEAQAFGLTLDQDLAEGWRESREWCWICGRHRLLGKFEVMPDGLINFRMRCPQCLDIVGTGGYPALEGMKAFRPALKRVWRTISVFSAGLAVGQQPCPRCGMLRPTRVLSSEEFAAAYPSSDVPIIQKSMLMLECPPCGVRVQTVVDGALMWHPVVQRFSASHPRFITEPEVKVEYAGQTAICLRLVDIASASRLTLLIEHTTLRVLAVFDK